jgi:processive 1,2-diacylglycerol beta-glucosyltransferase
MRVERFVNNVHEYMHASDLLITKPGGLTSSEALAAEIPMVLFKPLPGQEERNTRYLVQRRAAVRAKNASDLTRTVQTLLASPAKLGQMRIAMEPLRKPQAAREIARAIRAVAERQRRGEAIA